jgi:hypothetical protein
VSGDEQGHTNEAVRNINPPTHTIPESWSDDAFHHEIDEDCPCGPTSQPVQREDGSVGWVIVHHSLDGREKDEVSR